MDKRVIHADFTNCNGRKIRPMHGVGQPPILGGEPSVNPKLFHYLEEAGIPYSRLHDVGGRFGAGVFVDVPNIFRDFDADVNDPASYDFAHTDVLIRELYNYKVEPIYRLGITIENAANIKAYHVFPPKDFQKWAEICEHIIRHYNEGWADGFHYGMKYWEIWNEPDVDFNPDDIAQTWHGTREEFLEFYHISATHLKNCFGDSIAVGGFAAIGYNDHEIWDPLGEGVDPQYANKEHKRAYRIDYTHKFLAYVKEHGSPLDFFSWHCYTDDGPETILGCEKHCRLLLNKYGFADVPDMLDEWNAHRARSKDRALPKVTADTFAVLLGSQRGTTEILCYYDARIGASVYGGMFNPDTFEPYKTYYAFKSFNSAYKLGNEIETSAEEKGLYVVGARNDKKGVILIANASAEPMTLELDVKGADINQGEVIMTDEEYLYTMVGDIIRDYKLNIKAYSCIEIRVAL